MVVVVALHWWPPLAHSCSFLGKKTTRLISNQPPSLLALIHRKTRAVCICYCLLSTITGGGDCLDRLLTRLKLLLLFGSCIFFFSFSVCLHPSSIFVASLLLLILLLLLLLLSRRFSIYLFSSNGVELWWISSPQSTFSSSSSFSSRWLPRYLNECLRWPTFCLLRCKNIAAQCWDFFFLFCSSQQHFLMEKRICLLQHLKEC